jgi:hypothetical protein
LGSIREKFAPIVPIQPVQIGAVGLQVLHSTFIEEQAKQEVAFAK